MTKNVYVWCPGCAQVTPQVIRAGRLLRCDGCGHERPLGDRKVPNVFPRGRGF